MLCGIFFWRQLNHLEFAVPYLIFGMLFMTFLKVKLHELRFSPYHLWLLVIQIALSLGSYYLLLGTNPIWASGIMICFICPTATASAVIIGMLGGNIAFSTPYVLLSHMAVAFGTPVIFSAIGAAHGGLEFWPTVWHIFSGVIPLVLFPLMAAQFLRLSLPRVHKRLTSIPQLAFYLWVVTLAIILSKPMKFIMMQPKERIYDEIMLGVMGLTACATQFTIGKLMGKKIHGEPITMGQVLGQKNTSLAIWMALTYLDPLSSIAPAGYVIWQNTLNSIQLWMAGQKSKQQA